MDINGGTDLSWSVKTPLGYVTGAARRTLANNLRSDVMKPMDCGQKRGNTITRENEWKMKRLFVRTFVVTDVSSV